MCLLAPSSACFSSCPTQDIGINARADILNAIYNGMGGTLSDVAASILSIPDTVLADVAASFKVGLPDVSIGDISNALYVSAL